jgi:hypothetical protein
MPCVVIIIGTWLDLAARMRGCEDAIPCGDCGRGLMRCGPMDRIDEGAPVDGEDVGPARLGMVPNFKSTATSLADDDP